MTVEMRTFRLPPRDRTGVFMGLGPIQFAVGGGTLFLGIAAFYMRRPIIGLLVLVFGAILATARWRGTPVVAMAPQAGRAARHAATQKQDRWVSELGSGVLPSPLNTQRIVEVPAAPFGLLGQVGPVAVVLDTRARVWAATLRVAGPQFSLASPGDQERYVLAWSEALAPLSREASPIAWVRWSEWVGPATMEEHRSWLDEHMIAAPGDPARDSYEALLAGVGPASTNHEILITLAVDETRCRARRDQRRAGNDRERLAQEVLARETKLLAGRLQAASLTVRGPLNAHQLARAVACRLTPSRLGAIDGHSRRFGAEAGLVSPRTMGPHSSEMTAASWRCDGTWHRGMYIEEWPRSEVAADWLAPLLLFGGAVRTLSVFYEPVAPSRSRGNISSQSTKLDSEAEQRQRRGFRVGADHTRQSQAVEEREWELVAGFRDQDYAGVIDVSASSPEELDDRCAELVQVANAAGVELRELWWRHDQVAAASLPLAFGLATSPVRGLR